MKTPRSPPAPLSQQSLLLPPSSHPAFENREVEESTEDVAKEDTGEVRSAVAPPGIAGTGVRSEFTELNPLANHVEVFLSHLFMITAPEVGSIQLLLQSVNILTVETLYVPELKTLLLSVSRLQELHLVTFNKALYLLRTDVIGRWKDHVFQFTGSTKHIASAAATARQISEELWHQQLGHLGRQSVRALLRCYEPLHGPSVISCNGTMG
ncbi:hypothetical protein Q9L58_004035 [Maublancomyces gigas]|uniref:GAG-pre-integrase domain-containing protein n=1 Tax=Discina gigas TaxID=1032678 RepID=A0ABR3GM28_9PEZI